MARSRQLASPTYQTAMRVDADTDRVIDALSAYLGVSKSAVVRIAVRLWAQSLGLWGPGTYLTPEARPGEAPSEE
jgi:hypothetical protein